MSKVIVNRWVLELPCHVARANKLKASPRGWWAAYKLRKRDDLLILNACRAARVPPAAGKRRIDLHVILGPRQRIGDADEPFHKSLLDALKNAGAIRGDAKKWCEVTPTTYGRGPKEGMVVTIVDVVEGEHA